MNEGLIIDDAEDYAFYQSGLSADGCLEKLDDYTRKAIKRYGEILLEKQKEDFVKGFKGWVDCKTGKPCGRQKGEKRRSYPACRPTMAQCTSAARKKKGPKRISWKKNK